MGWVLRGISHHRGYYAGSPTTVGTTRDRPPPWVIRGIAHHRGYYAGSPTTVGTTRDRPPPWVLRGIAHHRGYYAESPTTVGKTRDRHHRGNYARFRGNEAPQGPRSAKVPRYHTHSVGISESLGNRTPRTHTT